MAGNLLRLKEAQREPVVMPKLIVKPTINFLSTDTDSQLIIRVHGIIQALTGNADYPNPLPPLSLVSDAQHAFEAACSNAALGGMLLTAIKNAKRGELVSLIRQLASYVTVACHGDLPTLLGSGFSIHKPTRDKIGRLPTPQMPLLRHGAQTGEIKAKTRSIRGVFIYNWQITQAGAPEQVLQTLQTTGATATFTKLTPGQVYHIRGNAVGAAGATDWSGPASLMAL